MAELAERCFLKLLAEQMGFISASKEADRFHGAMQCWSNNVLGSIFRWRRTNERHAHDSFGPSLFHLTQDSFTFALTHGLIGMRTEEYHISINLRYLVTLIGMRNIISILLLKEQT